MSRNRIGPKKVAKYRKQTGLDVLTALTRGGTDHRVDLLISDGTIVYLYKDGTTEKAIGITWDIEKWNPPNKHLQPTAQAADVDQSEQS